MHSVCSSLQHDVPGVDCKCDVALGLLDDLHHTVLGHVVQRSSVDAQDFVPRLQPAILRCQAVWCNTSHIHWTIALGRVDSSHQAESETLGSTTKQSNLHFHWTGKRRVHNDCSNSVCMLDDHLPTIIGKWLSNTLAMTVTLSLLLTSGALTVTRISLSTCPSRGTARPGLLVSAPS